MLDLIALLIAALLGLGSSTASGSAAADPAPAAHERQVVLEVGHCWVEPVRVDGRLWGVPLRRQVGWGGPLPRDWVGAGGVTVLSPHRATYLDDGGTSLPLRPADHPSVSLDGLMCR